MENRRGRAIHCRAARGATLIEIVVIVAMFYVAWLGARYSQRTMGGRWGWLPGGSVGFVLPLIVLGVLAFVSDLAIGGMPRLPRCREGTCRGPDAYKSGKFGEEYHLVCRHGGRYKRHGGKFVIVNEDGTETPYLIWRPFRGWFPDDPKGSKLSG
jgi:hypothetical protein